MYKIKIKESQARNFFVCTSCQLIYPKIYGYILQCMYAKLEEIPWIKSFMLIMSEMK